MDEIGSAALASLRVIITGYQRDNVDETCLPLPSLAPDKILKGEKLVRDVENND